MKLSKPNLVFASSIAILLIAISIFALTSITINSTNVNLGWSVSLTVKVDGKVVYYAPHDLIMNTAYAYVVCKAFNDTESSGACYYNANSATPLNLFVGSTSNTSPNYLCSSYTTGGAIMNNVFLSKEVCVMSAVWLSTDTSAPTTAIPNCNSISSSFSTNPVKGVWSAYANTNTITLTASFTASSASTNVDKVCIGFWNDKANHAVDTSSGTGSPTILTADLFTAPTISNGQSFQVVYSINF